MIILSGKDIKKSYGIDTIIEGVTFTVQETDKIGVVGVNGAGKSTLFKILTGEIERDGGDIFIGKDIKLAYMSQDFEFQSDNSIWDELLTVYAHLIGMEKRIEALENEISTFSQGGESEALDSKLKAYADLQHRFEEQNGFGYKSQIRGILKGLGFSQEDYEKPINTLSGGQKTRIALGKILLTKNDILMLDEPTNYLDIDSVQWLEDFLKNYKGALLIISHDRYFLDMVTNRTFEMENKRLNEYGGSYSKYVEKKEEAREQLLKDYELQQKDIERQQAIITRFRQYNREKSIRQAESREKALERIDKVDRPENLPKNVKFKFDTKFRSGNDVLIVDNLAKAYDRLLFSNVSFEIKRGEKVALLGPNGIGKTTLMKIILDRVVQNSGNIKLGTQVYTGYYEQEHEHLNMNNIVIDEIWDEFTSLNQTEIRTKLAAFLFEGEDVFKEVFKLSGGERSRLALLKLMLSSSNFLLMDEPTNHLDIPSKEVLESALSNYSGTVLLISHDRYFLNKVATKIIDLTKEGCITYPGNYDYYINKKNALLAENADLQIETDVDELSSKLKTDWHKAKEEKSTLKKQQKRYETIESDIEKCENQIREINELMTQPEIFSDHIRCASCNKEAEDLKIELENLYEEWDELNQLFN